VNELQVLNIDGVECYEKDGTAYLRLETVARGLGFIQEKNGIEYVRWDRVEGYLSEIGFPHKWGKDDFIPENVFYRLAMKAKNEVAERFQAKVADEIIPSIRKHGGYIAGQEKLSDDELLAKALLVAQSKIAEKDRLLAQKQERIDQMKPKEIFADSVATSRHSILIGDLAKIICQNGYQIGQKRLFQWMRDKGYLMVQGSSYNRPKQKYIEQGLFEIKESTINNPDGSVRVTLTTKVTGKGQIFFINKFLGEKNDSKRVC
jgi:anti-repressor protein